MRWFVVLAVVLAGCVALKPPPAPLNGFSASGRISVRSGNDAHYANFGWQAEPQADRLAFGNPLGQILAELDVSYFDDAPVHAVLRDADGNARAGAPEALLFEATGMRLPVAGLRWWMQGLPAPGRATSRETAEGRLIEQDGWRILASDFFEQTPVPRGPRKVELRRDDMTVRIVISEWQWQTSSRP